MAQYTAEQVYSTARQEIQDKIRSLAEDRLSDKMMEREGEEASYRVSMRTRSSSTIRSCTASSCPGGGPTPSTARPSSTTFAEEYKFRVERERREFGAQEDRGRRHREFQQIVSQGISDSYLRWRGIEATLGFRNPRIRRW